MSVIIKKIDNSFVQILTENKQILQKLNKHFTFFQPGYQYTTQYKMNYWDGKIRLFDIKNNTLSFGLVFESIKIIKSLTNDIKIDQNIFKKGLEATEQEINKFCELIKLPFKPYQHQIEAVQKSLKRKRITIESATGSGKSLNLFLMCNFLKMNREDEKILIVVPTVQLVEQMTKDFQEYASNYTDYSKYIQKIYSSMDKDLKWLTDVNIKSDKYIVISTWQSMMNFDKKYLKAFSTVFCDECLHPDTYILMEDDKYKKIKDINVNDIVKTYNEKTKKIENKKVKKVYKNLTKTKKLFKIRMKNGNIIMITGNHKVLTNNGWKEVKNLYKNERILKYV